MSAETALTSAVSELITICEVMAAQSPSGGAGFTQGLARARAALAEVNPPPKAPPHPDDVKAESPEPATSEPTPPSSPAPSSSPPAAPKR